MGRYLRWAFFAVFVLAGPSTIKAVHAQQPSSAPPSPYAPVATPTVDFDSLKKPQAAQRPELAIPKGIDAGKSPLEFDARRTRDVTAPGVAIDSGETSNLSKVLPAQKEDQVLPDYFGLKLTTPTR